MYKEDSEKACQCSTPRTAANIDLRIEDKASRFGDYLLKQKHCIKYETLDTGIQ